MRLRLDTPETRLDERGERRLAELEREQPRVDPRELEEVVDELPEHVDLLAHRRQVVLRLGEPVLDRLEHRLQRGERRPQVVARPGDELPASVEQLLDVARHLVERGSQLRELAWAAVWRPRRKLAARERGRRRREAADPGRDRVGDEPGRAGGDRRRGRGDRQDDDVGAHVEHRDPREDHGRQRQRHGRQGEPGQLAAQRRQQPQREGRDEPDGEHRPRDGEGEPDHATSR